MLSRNTPGEEWTQQKVDSVCREKGAGLLLPSPRKSCLLQGEEKVQSFSRGPFYLKGMNMCMIFQTPELKSNLC